MEQKLYPSLTPATANATASPTAPPPAPYDVESMINKHLQSELQKVNSFNNSIQNISLMMKYYEMEENKYKQKYNKYKLINNLINSLDGIIVIGTTSASISLSITGVGIIVVPIAAGVGCTTGILVKICSSYLKKKEQNYKLKYTIIQKTLDDFRQLYVASLKDNCIDEKEYHRFVTQFENYQATANAASQEIHTKSRAASRTASHTASHTKSQVASRATANAALHATATTASHTPPTIPLKPHNFL